MAKATIDPTLPDWWQREKQRRQSIFLVFLVLLLILIAYHYKVSNDGITGTRPGINFDSSNYIAFVNQDDKGNVSLYAIRADGTDARRLSSADDPSNKQDPAWTLDGKSLLYASNKNDNKVSQIYALGTGDPKQLTYGTGNKFAPIASPDGKHIAFVTQGAIKTVLLNGNDVQQVVPPPRAGNSDTAEGAAPNDAELRGPYQYARFSEDGRGIAGVQSLSTDDNPFTISQFGDQVARALPPDGIKAEVLDAGREVSVAWEPNGSRVVCAFSERQMPDTHTPDKILSGIRLWKLDPTGKKLPEAEPVIIGIGYSMEPKNVAWSPDGKLLAFECWRLKSEGNRELLGLVLLPAQQAGQIRTEKEIESLPFLVKASPGGRPQNPRWSPDGSRIVFEMLKADGKHDLCLINSDGTNPLNLTGSLGGDNTQPAWSPAHK